MKKLYWLSWNQPTEDYRPLQDPPAEGILGWWCSGHGEWPMICAHVVASSEKLAWGTVRKSWPEVTPSTHRFINEHVGDGPVRPGDRFPITPGEWRDRRYAEYEAGRNIQIRRGRWQD